MGLTTYIESDTTAYNIRNLYWEIGFSSVLGAIITFNSAFAVHMGASALFIALLGSVPALINALISIPAGKFLGRQRKHKVWILASLVFYRASYAGVVLIPFIFQIHAASWLVVWMVALNVPLAFFTPGWTSMLGELVPEKRRGFVVSRRMIIWAAGIALVSWLGGIWLDHVAFPLNYQWLYTFGLISSIPNQYFLGRLIVPDQEIRPQVKKQPGSEQPVVLSTPLKRMLVNTLIYQLGLSLPAQLFNIYYIKSLGASDGWIGINAAAANLGVIAGYFVWERVLRRRSFFWGLQRGTLLTWIFPVGLAFLTNLNLIMVLNFSVNFMHSCVDLSSFNVLHKLATPRERQAYVSWYTMIVNLSIFAAPLIGALFADNIPLALLISGVLRIAGGILFNVNGIEGQASKPAVAH